MMIEQFDSLAELIRSRLGCRVVFDLADITPPCALVTLDRADTPLLSGELEVHAAVYLIASDTGTRRAMAALLEQLSELADLTTGAQPEMITPPDGAPLPALRLDPISL